MADPAFGLITPTSIPTTQTDVPSKPSTPKGKAPKTNPERLQLLVSRLKVAKAWAKKPHESWERWIDEYEIEDFKDIDEVRDRVRIGYVFRKIESDLPSIFDDQPQLFIKGRKGNVTPIQPLIEGLYDYLWDIQHLDEKIEDVGLYFELLGMGFLKSPWVTKTEQVQSDGVADPLDVPTIDNPMASVPDPFKLYFSPETKFAPVLDYDHCPYYFEKMLWTPDRVKAQYGVEVDANESLKTTDTDTDLEIDSNQEPVAKDDLKRTTVYEYYGCLPQDLAPKGSDWEYDKDYHIVMTMKEELLVEDNPYQSKPLFVVGNYGLANKFWRFGDAKHLMPLIQELQMYRTQVLQHTRKMANPKPLIPTSATIDENAFLDPRVGRPVKYDGATPPTYLQPGQLGREVEYGIQQVRVDLEKEGGSFDLEGGGNQSTVKSPRGIQVFSEAADRNTRRKRKKIARFIREILIFQFAQVGANWKPEDNRTLTVISPTGSQPQQGAPQQGSQTQDIQVDQMVLDVISGVNIMYQLDIETESLSINKATMRQDALNLWDLASVHPDIFKLPEIAKWVMESGFGMRDGDRFLLSDQERQQMAQGHQEQPKVNVSIKADAATPPGAALLENEQLLKPGQGTQGVIDNSVLQSAQVQEQAKADMAKSHLDTMHQMSTAHLSHLHQGVQTQQAAQNQSAQSIQNAALQPPLQQTKGGQT